MLTIAPLSPNTGSHTKNENKYKKKLTTFFMKALLAL